MLVKFWMQGEVITIQEDGTIAEAGTLMEEHSIRRIPVINSDNRLLGIISKEDLKSALPSAVDSSSDATARALASQVKVTTFMTHQPITLLPSDPLEKAASLMRKNKIGGIPVTEEDQLLGIITESDIFDAFVEIMGGTNRDVRIECTIDCDGETLHRIFEMLSMHDVSLNNIAISNNFSTQKRKIVLRIQSGHHQAIVDELWELGCQITSIIDTT